MAPCIDAEAEALAALTRGHLNNFWAVASETLAYRGRPLLEAYVWARGGAELEEDALAALASAGARPTAEAVFLAFVTHASQASLARLLAHTNANLLAEAAPRIIWHLTLTGDAPGLRRFFAAGGALPPAASMPAGRLLHAVLDAPAFRDGSVAAVARLLVAHGADQNERDEWGRTPYERATSLIAAAA